MHVLRDMLLKYSKHAIPGEETVVLSGDSSFSHHNINFFFSTVSPKYCRYQSMCSSNWVRDLPGQLTGRFRSNKERCDFDIVNNMGGSKRIGTDSTGLVDGIDG